MAATLWVCVAAFTFLALALYGRRLEIEGKRARLAAARNDAGALRAEGARS
jgi:hypothetical protein